VTSANSWQSRLISVYYTAVLLNSNRPEALTQALESLKKSRISALLRNFGGALAAALKTTGRQPKYSRIPAT